MSLLGIDIGGTKIAFAIFSVDGTMLSKETHLLNGKGGTEAGALIADNIRSVAEKQRAAGDGIQSIGISVPGIYRSSKGTVWAPNIPGWNDYPLLDESKTAAGDIPVAVDSDRACSILGEMWKGNARGCRNAVFIAVGTGIGAGIVINGEVLRGNSDIAGATGWMALSYPFDEKYRSCGCFEYYASGEGIVRSAREIRKDFKYYHGDLEETGADKLTARDVFSAYEDNDPVAVRVIDQSVQFWGMAVANFISIFNPEKIILGGGVFGPAEKFLRQIIAEAGRWAQPISFSETVIEVTSLHGDAAVYGAGHLALKNLNSNTHIL